MEVIKLQEAGYEQALLGLSLSFYDHKEPLALWWNAEKFSRAERRAKALAHKGGGHNKFLESIQVWLFVQAPRCWWSEFDTYRTGMTKNSSSTMHTLDKRETEAFDYETGTSQQAINAFNISLQAYKNPESFFYKDITRLKMNLPEGWYQERQISTNYMTLQNIIRQREGHRFHYWNTVFIKSVLEQVEHPYFLIKQENENE